MTPLLIRILLYMIAIPLATWGFADVDLAAGTITIHMNSVGAMAGAVGGGGLLGAATFAWSRFAKLRGGMT